ncbi:MAG: flippase, partial [Bacteroidaceae bacterium]|nr:flippase [Bacteroidaceae bacterium]
LESDAEAIILVIIYSASIFCNCFVVIRNYFLAIVQNEYVVKSEIMRTLLGSCIKLALLWAHASLLWFVVASVFDFVLLSGGYITAYRKQVGSLLDWTFDKVYARVLFSQGLPLLLTSAAVIIYQRIDQIMIGNMIDKASVGYFSTASKFVEVLIFVPTMLARTITPVLVTKLKENVHDYRQKAQVFMNITFWLSVILASLVAVSSYWIVLYTFGERYLPAVAVLQVLAFKAPSVALSTTAGSMLVIEGLQGWAVLRDLFGCVVCIGLNFYFLPQYGIMAAAVVAILSNLAAGYLADAFIPVYRHLFVHQTKALLFGWKDLIHLKQFLPRAAKQ